MTKLIVYELEEIKEFMVDNEFIVDHQVDYDQVVFTKKVNEIDYIFSITTPHEGNGFVWLFRADRTIEHDRWANCDWETEYTDVKDFKENALKNVEEVFNPDYFNDEE